MMPSKAMLMGFMLMIFLSAVQVYAAQDSTVIQDNAPIVTEPKKGAKAIEYLPIGSEVRISSYGMQGGWYKIRSKSGIYGWINEKYLSVYKSPDEGPKEKTDYGPRPERDRKWFLRGVGGFDFFRPDDLNTLFSFTDLNTGYSLGGELGVFISERVSVCFRIEAIVKDITARERTSNINFNLSIRSYPVMGGMDFYFVKLPPLRLSLGIFGGMAMATSFASEAPALDKPNLAVLQRSPFTSYVRLNLTRPLGRIFSVFMEAGYRYLRTEEIETTATQGIQGGTAIYAKDGIFRNRVIDLSGVVIAGGVGVHF
jgi:hypothetical protein